MIKSTKKALFLSLVSIFICFTMLLGTTYAWFTDSVSSDINTIVAGNLDVELYHTSATKTNEKVDSNTLLFSLGADQKWEPGAMVYEKFTIANEGNLALKYQFKLDVVNATEVDGVSFTKMLKVAVIEDENFVYNRENVMNYTGEWKELGEFISTGDLDGKTDVTKTKTFGIVIYWMPTDNDNTFNMNNGETTEASVEVGVSLLATQMESESDSFDEHYDAEAVASGSVSGAAPAAGEIKTYTVFNNLTGAAVAEMTIPAEAVADGATSISISIVPTEQDANITIDEDTQNAKSYDFSVSGIKEGNTEEIDVELFVGKGLDNVKVYHKTTLLTSTYDPDTGIVSFATTSFSPYTLVWDKPIKKITVTTAEELLTALEDVNENVVIDATGVTIDPSTAGYSSPTGKMAIDVPGGVTIKNLNVSGSYRGGNAIYLVGGSSQKIVFENCTFELSGRSMGMILSCRDAGISSVVYNNCNFKGAITLESPGNPNAVATYNNCTFTKHPGSGNTYVMAYGGTHTFNACTFDYTGLSQSSMGIIDTAAVNVSSESDGSNSTTVILDGCTRISCGTRKYGANSTLIIK